MNVRKKNLAVAAMVCAVWGWSAPAVADLCSDTFQQGQQLYEQASAALARKDYGEAIRLYRTAETYYSSVTRMKNCRCPKVANVAANNMKLCRDNVERAGRAMAAGQKNASEQERVAEYNRALTIARQGDSFATSQRWEQAVRAFDEASVIWGRMADASTEIGRSARQSAQAAREKAALARQELQK